ncbi:MAG: hypothetical protein R6X33_04095 [Candidatus Brocadiia bacterium]
MRGLKTCLWIAGLFCLLSVFGLLLPMSALRSLAGVFGGGELPEAPVFVYALRVSSATYLAVGAFFILLARDPMRYGLLVPFAGGASVLVGVVCGVTGLLSGMPAGWFLGDFLTCTVLGILILVFWRRATSAPPENVAGSEPE